MLIHFTKAYYCFRFLNGYGYYHAWKQKRHKYNDWITSAIDEIFEPIQKYKSVEQEDIHTMPTQKDKKRLLQT